MKSSCQLIDSKMMALAAKEASRGLAANKGGPFGAVITKDGRVIAKASNEVLYTNDPTMHAEINAIRKASKKLGSFDLSGCVLYSSCMPCPMCLAAIKWANIKSVYYGATTKDADRAGFRDEIFYDEKIQNLELVQCERDACLKPFAEWKNKQDRVVY